MPNPTADSVQKALDRIGLAVPAEPAEKLATYLELLEKWNRKMNLVGPPKWQEMLETLIVDSIHLAEFLGSLGLAEKPLCLDLGAGAGLPGIPLRMLWQQGKYWLVEVRQKRAGFMRTALSRLDLPGTFVFNGKAEEALARLEAETGGSTADLILSKAFMPWRELLDFTSPMLSHGGMLVILSNDEPPEAMPQGWELASAASYPIAGKTHYFWAVTQK